MLVQSTVLSVMRTERVYINIIECLSNLVQLLYELHSSDAHFNNSVMRDMLNA